MSLAFLSSIFAKFPSATNRLLGSVPLRNLFLCENLLISSLFKFINPARPWSRFNNFSTSPAAPSFTSIISGGAASGPIKPRVLSHSFNPNWWFSVKVSNWALFQALSPPLKMLDRGCWATPSICLWSVCCLSNLRSVASKKPGVEEAIVSIPAASYTLYVLESSADFLLPGAVAFKNVS